MNQTLKATLIGITSTLAFAATANQAQALDFTFSGYSAGTSVRAVLSASTTQQFLLVL